eukprot:TRINITY_DN7696_c0_g1_i3.p1 TRINITY_DN7696_c0_g1~~TRINITY_DN7696_c0_g1_i3.p1  ORF type:complete len:362 (+),score=15.43 TRINITY_DN7696_c0_g1_i3:80-1165(+)
MQWIIAAAVFATANASFDSIEYTYNVYLLEANTSQTFHGRLYKDDGLMVHSSHAADFGPQICSEPFECSDVRPTMLTIGATLTFLVMHRQAYVTISSSCPISSIAGCIDKFYLLSYSIQGPMQLEHQCTLPAELGDLFFNTTTNALQAVYDTNPHGAPHKSIVAVNPATCKLSTLATWQLSASPFTWALNYAAGLAVALVPVDQANVQPQIYQLIDSVFKQTQFKCPGNLSSDAVPLVGPSGTILASSNPALVSVYVFAQEHAQESCMQRALTLDENCNIYNFSDARPTACRGTPIQTNSEAPLTDMVQTYVTTYGVDPGFNARRVWDQARDGQRISSRNLLELPREGYSWASITSFVLAT